MCAETKSRLRKLKPNWARLKPHNITLWFISSAALVVAVMAAARVGLWFAGEFKEHEIEW